MNLVTLNVGGTLFQTNQKTLMRYPETLLGEITKASKYYNSKTNQFFFDRNPSLFNEILDFYRTGTLHLPSGICGGNIKEELEFWKISVEHIAECCLHKYLLYETDVEVNQKIKSSFEEIVDYTDEECRRSKVKCVLRKVWLTMDQPTSSMLAQVFNYIFLLVVALSMVSFTLASHPDFRDQKITYTYLLFLRKYRDYKFFDDLDLNNPKMVMFGTSLPAQYLLDLDLFCTVFFTLEFLLHFLSSPKKKTFFWSPLNILDPVLLFAMWTAFSLEQDLVKLVTNYDLIQLYLVTKSLVVLRLFRVFRMVKVYSGLRILMLSVRASLKELFMMTICIMIAALFFASFIYYAEFKTPDTFPNIFIGIWWAIVTMTTIGYGDIYPTSVYGYIVGSICAFCGVLLISMPIAVVATNFNEYYQKNKLRDMRNVRLKKEKEEREKKIPNGIHPKIAPVMITNM